MLFFGGRLLLPSYSPPAKYIKPPELHPAGFHYYICIHFDKEKRLSSFENLLVI